MEWIRNKTVLITGASSGIGRALTEKLVRYYGCRVIGIGQSEEKLHYVKTNLTYMTDFFEYRAFDVSQEENWDLLAMELKEEGRKIDILINNVGTLPMLQRVTNYKEEVIRETFDVNYYSYRYAVNALLPILRESNMPGIVNIVSADALVPLLGTSAHSESQAALLSYSKSLVAELGREMYVGYMIPGFVDTEYFRNQYKTIDKRLQKRLKLTPEKAAEKISRKILKQKVRGLIGRDAKFMDKFSRLFPALSVKWYEIKVKHSKAKLFENVK